jgi:tetratricopeptide (TPR) repeat protein
VIEAFAAFAQNDLPRAERILQSAQEKFPQLDGGFLGQAQLYMGRAEQCRNEGKPADSLQYLTNAVSVFERQMSLQPTNVAAPINCGAVLARLQDNPRALVVLNKALEMDPNNQMARLNRAIAHLQSGHYDAARQDYQQVVQLNPSCYQAYYGLGEAAYKKSDWMAAANNFDLYLRYAPRNTAEFTAVEARRAEVKKKTRW